MTLTDFLLARIAEDEDRVFDWERQQALAVNGSLGYANRDRAMWEHIGVKALGFTPHRIRAECAAKRRIVEYRYSWNLQAENALGPPFGPILKAQVITADSVLRALALPYADHPDYDPAWRP